MDFVMEYQKHASFTKSQRDNQRGSYKDFMRYFRSVDPDTWVFDPTYGKLLGITNNDKNIKLESERLELNGTFIRLNMFSYFMAMRAMDKQIKKMQPSKHFWENDYNEK
jgi:hypothetical protein